MMCMMPTLDSFRGTVLILCLGYETQLGKLQRGSSCCGQPFLRLQDTSREPGHSHPVLLLCEIKIDQAGCLWLKKKKKKVIKLAFIFRGTQIQMLYDQGQVKSP